MEQLVLYLFSAAILGVIVGILTHKCHNIGFKPPFLNTFWGILAIFGAIEIAPYYEYVEMYSMLMIVPAIGTGLLSKFKLDDSFKKGFWFGYSPVGWFILISCLRVRVQKANINSNSIPVQR